jgi:formiminoglutamase
MNLLPLLVSVPHAGLDIPDEVRDLAVLPSDEIARDGDVGAREIYDIADAVSGFVTTSIARAFVDLNRAPDDRTLDGVVKTHTCWNVPVYARTPAAEWVRELLSRHSHPYHSRLDSLGASGRFVLGVDCHTMAAEGPPVGPDPGRKRPHICLGSGDGACPPAWMTILEDCFRGSFGPDVTRDEPFGGGYIVQRHGARMPWVQLEMSRAGFAPDADKRRMVLAALEEFVERISD